MFLQLTRSDPNITERKLSMTSAISAAATPTRPAAQTLADVRDMLKEMPEPLPDTPVMVSAINTLAQSKVVPPMTYLPTRPTCGARLRGSHLPWRG